MSSTPRPPVSVIVAGTFSIIAGVLGAFFALTAIATFSMADLPRGTAFPDFMRPVLTVMWAIFLLCAVFAVVVGIQVIRLRNWARISLLVIAGCLLFFGVIGILVIFVTMFLAPLPDSRVSRSLLVSVLAVTYGFPIAISLWWLILFTRRSIAMHFHSSAVTAASSKAISSFRLSKPGCPMPVRVIGWYLASFALVLPLVPFLPVGIPAIYFGHIFHGPAAMLLYTLNFALLVIPGLGLLLLKRWSYQLTIASQLVICASSISSALSPAYVETMRAMFAQMHAPEFIPVTDNMLSYLGYFSLLGLLIPVAILITLVVVRRQFFAAADADAAGT